MGELSREMIRTLVRARRAMYFLPAPEEVSQPDADGAERDLPPELLRLLATPPSGSGSPAGHQVDNKLQTAQDRTSLARRIRETFRQARSSIEEQGVNTLYLALGLLRWHESDNSELEPTAPLILIPVRLDRTEVRHTFRLA